jgi:acetyltransferase-like isoleucine patch superfamily enzyme
MKMKWTVWNELMRMLLLPYTRLYFMVRGVSWNTNWRVLGAPIIQKYQGSKIKIGTGAVMRSWTASNPVAPFHPVLLSTRSAGAEIIIGEDFGITGGSLIAAEKITIGDRVLVGGNCLIADTDFHPLDKTARVQDPKKASCKPVSIGDDVFIGTQSIILKGTSIGSGTIIGAGSVVSGEIPPNVVAAGNPAVIIREIKE